MDTCRVHRFYNLQARLLRGFLEWDLNSLPISHVRYSFERWPNAGAAHALPIARGNEAQVAVRFSSPAALDLAPFQQRSPRR